MNEPWPTLPTPAQELLLKAALIDGEAGLSAWRRWKRLDTVTGTDHDSGRLFPLLGRRLLRAGVDDPDLSVLKSSYRHQWLVSQQRLAAAARALEILARSRIRTMVLKGAPLAQRYYRDVGARPMYDVDVLVPPDSARAAIESLTRSGWIQFWPAPPELLLPVTHGTLLKDEPDTGVDLHWYSMWTPVLEQDLWAAAEPIEVAGAATLAPCPADELLLACVHGIWSDGRPVRWVADALAVLRSSPELDWDRVLRRARAGAVTLPLALALEYLAEHFDAGVPRDVLAELERMRAPAIDRLTHRAWRGRPSKRRLVALALARYRRLRRLPPGPTREPSLRRYLRVWLRVTMQLDASQRLGPALLSSALRQVW